MEVVDSFQCNKCNNSFNQRSSLNRHLRKIHKVNLEPQTTRECHIKCILCTFDQVIATFATYNDYNKHLEDVHQINVYLSRKPFESKEKFDLWYEEGKRNVNYAIKKCVATQYGKRIYYNCNRSDSKGFKSQGTKNMLKTGGSIKLQGTCPSRIIANFIENGHVIVHFFETHLGHEEEVRAQRLTKKEQIYLVDQMKQGVSKQRIIANARKFNLPDSGMPGRINSINRNDLLNLSRRYNVEKIKRNDLVATTAHQAADERMQCVDMVNADNIDIPSLANEDALDGTGNATNEKDELLMEKRESNETESIGGNRQLEMFREHISNFVDEICLADEDSLNFFQRGWNSLELQTRKKLNQTTNKRKGDKTNEFECL